MKYLFALLTIFILSAMLVLISPLVATGNQNSAPQSVDRGWIGTMCHKSNSSLVAAQIEPKLKKIYESPCSLPKKDSKDLRFKATVTAYNSVPEQTDGDPCIAADGSDICEALGRGERACAANCLPFGTRLEVPGFGTCVVRDRTASRYGSRIDIYFGGRDQIKTAKAWGKKELTLTVK